MREEVIFMGTSAPVSGCGQTAETWFAVSFPCLSSFSFSSIWDPTSLCYFISPICFLLRSHITFRPSHRIQKTTVGRFAHRPAACPPRDISSAQQTAETLVPVYQTSRHHIKESPYSSPLGNKTHFNVEFS